MNESKSPFRLFPNKQRGTETSMLLTTTIRNEFKRLMIRLYPFLSPHLAKTIRRFSARPEYILLKEKKVHFILG
ncbi:MAG: hypothetical protein K1X56_07955 [Flavobacteriales bacterium]|nr:hypothetical protein [Flavobacteriales bacterium]